MTGWKKSLNNLAIQPIQQFRYTVGKNSTDSAMIIDAMDILHDGLVEGFCIVSSDSDYTRLATRIRESGIFVMGIGQQKTPKAFVNACNIFICTENLTHDPALKKKTKSKKSTTSTEELTTISDPIPLLKEAFEMAVTESGWVELGVMGNCLRQLDPSFDPRSYGHKQLSQLIKEYTDLFELKSQGKNGTSIINIKIKD